MIDAKRTSSGPDNIFYGVVPSSLASGVPSEGADTSPAPGSRSFISSQPLARIGGVRTEAGGTSVVSPFRGRARRPRPDHPLLSPEFQKTGKVCRTCGEFKTWDQLVKAKPLPDGHAAFCKDCKQAKARADYTPESGRARYFKTAYGITLEDYDRMLAEQDGKCAICSATDSGQEVKNGYGKRFHVDHDHTTGRVRSLLCSNCNRGIGCFRDNPELLDAAIAYLREWKQRQG